MTTFASDGTTTETPEPPAPADIAVTAAPPPAPPAPVDAAPTPEPVPVPEPEPEVIEPEPASSELAVPDGSEVAVDAQWEHTSEWAYDWLEFKGDKLAIRVPKGSALQALGNSRHCSLDFQDRLVHMFVAKHISDETYERITYRMVDPDDEEFTMKAWGELLNAIAELGAERAKAEAEALAAVTSDNGKKGKGR
jgi:hypothetical protein